MNGAVLRACLDAGHEVRLVLTRARFEHPVVRLPDPRLEVVGPGFVRRGAHLVVTSPRGLASILKREGKRLLVGKLRPVLRPIRIAIRGRATRAVLGSEPTPKSAARAARLVQAFAPQLVLVDTMFRMPVVERLAQPRPRVAVIAHDLFHERHRSLAAQGLRMSPASITAGEEAARLASADLIVAITSEDSAGFGRILPAVPRLVASVPAPVVRRAAGTARDPERVVFLGSLGAHNRDALAWTVSELWPRIRARCPGAVLDVLGSVGADLPRGCEGAVAHGVVERLAPALHRASVAIAPLRAGSGLKIKILDYLAHGLPVVATRTALAGFEEQPGGPLLGADEADAFAAMVTGLLADPGRVRVLEEAAYQAASRFGEAETLGPLLRWIESGSVARPAAFEPGPTMLGARVA